MDWKIGKLVAKTPEELIWGDKVINEFKLLKTSIDSYLDGTIEYHKLFDDFKLHFGWLEHNGFNIMLYTYRIEGLGIPYFYLDMVLTRANYVYDSVTFCSNDTCTKEKHHVNNIRNIKIEYDFKYRTIKDINIRAEIATCITVNPLFDICSYIKTINGSKNIKCSDIMGDNVDSVKLDPRDLTITRFISSSQITTGREKYKLIDSILTDIINQINTNSFKSKYNLRLCKNADASVTISQAKNIEELLNSTHMLFPKFETKKDGEGAIILARNIAVIKRKSYKSKFKNAGSRIVSISPFYK